MQQERSGTAAIGRWVGWLVVLALTVTVAVLTVAVVRQVTDAPLTRAAALPTAAAPAVPSGTVQALAGLSPQEVTLRPVGEAQPVLEQAGAVVLLQDAAGASRTVQPDWFVCAAGPPAAPDAPAGAVQLAAVPAGDACP